ncbi:GNAT family N-acetyltransferase [Reichenbachiella sp. MALMAid0571]|uniref:GNAT family N-acetyltransferase n=1 Tax=Reichenbachiella sp. MALMAid0571 TaxID=3143939 RepID=UPI0032DF0452
MRANAFISDLDTQRFGFNVAKINEFNHFTPEEILNNLRLNDVRLVISRVSSSNVLLINQLEYLGFEIKDIQVSYKHSLRLQDIIKIDQKVSIRDYKDDDLPHLKRIAYDSFYGYGHYARNSKLNKSKCAEIYSDWVERCSTDKKIADQLFVLVDKFQTAIGFFALKMNSKQNFAEGLIGAVDSRHRGQGLWKLIVNASIIWAKEKGAKYWMTKVLIDNYPSHFAMIFNNCYIRTSEVTMHKWID